MSHRPMLAVTVRRLLTTTGAALMVTACAAADSAVAPQFVEPVQPSLARATSPTPIAFTVSDDPAFTVRSDAGGEYVNGLQTVSATIDQYGNLQVSITSSVTPARTITFDYSRNVDPANTYQVDAGGQRWFRIKSNKSNNNNPGLTSMAVGSAGCYNVTLAHGNGVTQVQDWFNPAAHPSSTYVTIVRTSATTWTMDSTGNCGSNADWGAVLTQDVSRKNQPLVMRGYWYLGFHIQIRSL